MGGVVGAGFGGRYFNSPQIACSYWPQTGYPGFNMPQFVQKVAFLNTNNNMYLCAENGSLFAHPDFNHANLIFNGMHMGHFFVENHGAFILIRTQWGQYVSVNVNGQIYLSPMPVQPDSLLQLEWHPERQGQFALRAQYNKYIGVHNQMNIGAYGGGGMTPFSFGMPQWASGGGFNALVTAWPELTYDELFQEIPVA